MCQLFFMIPKNKANANIFDFKQRVLYQNCFRTVARSQHSQDVLHGHSHIADDRLAAIDICPNRYSVKQFLIACHGKPSFA